MPDIGTTELLILMIPLSVIVGAGYIAARKGRNAVLWSVLTLLFFPIPLLIVAVLPPVRARGQQGSTPESPAVM